MGLLGTRVCTARNTEHHYGTIEHSKHTKHAATDDSVRILDEKAGGINDGVVSLIRHSNNFLNEAVLIVEHCNINRRYQVSYLFKLNGRKSSGTFRERFQTEQEVDAFFTKKKTNELLAEVVANTLATRTIRYVAQQMQKRKGV